MPPIVHLVRHAQGFHNLCVENHVLPDPSLTPLGKQQCANLSTSFPTFFPSSGPPKITHLVASPLRRTLYTCLLSFPAAVAAGLPVIALPELQETSDLPCDTGSAVEKLREEFDGEEEWKGKVDLSRVGEGWNSKVGRWHPGAKAVERRARDARVFLGGLVREWEAKNKGKGEPEPQIVAVTHGGLLHYLTEDWVGFNAVAGTGWANCECRSYEVLFSSSPSSGAEKEEEVSLKETAESRQRRKGSERELSETEQLELRISAERGGVENGYISGEEGGKGGKL